ncbi:hypothetical protein B484DRAFT_435661, partial [Ochromonadaceae sp. CCMP2298]
PTSSMGGNKRGRKGAKGKASPKKNFGSKSQRASASIDEFSQLDLPAVRRTRHTYDGSVHQQQDAADEARRASDAAEALAHFEKEEEKRLLALRPSMCEAVKEGRLTRMQAREVLGGMAKSTFNEMYTRWDKKGYVVGPGHNPEFFDEQAIQGIQAECERGSDEGNGWSTTGEFKKMLEPFWRATLERRLDKRAEWLPFDISESALRARMSQWIPEARRQGDKQNAARFRCRVGFLPGICSAAVSRSALRGREGGLWPEDPTAVMPALILNTDAVSTVLNPSFEKKRVRVAKGTGKALRGEVYGVKTTTGLDAKDYDTAYSTEASVKRTSLTKSESLNSQNVPAPAKQTDRYSKPPAISCDPRLGPTSKYRGDSFACRGVHVDLAGNGAGALWCIMNTFVDSSIPEGKFHMWSFESGMNNVTVCMILRAKKVDEVKLELVKARKGYFPAAIRLRQRVTAAMAFDTETAAMDLALSTLEDDSFVLETTGEATCSSPGSPDTSRGNPLEASGDGHGMDSPLVSPIPGNNASPFAPEPAVFEALVPEYRMLFTMDGCGCPLKAMMKFFEDAAYFGDLPLNSSAYKHWNAGTALFQQHDACRGHSTYIQNVKLEKDVICTGEEVKLPIYMPVVHSILAGFKFPVKLYRTIYKHMANNEHWALAAMSRHTLSEGYRITGWVPWSLYAFLKRWAGFDSLTEEDLLRIGEAFPYLEREAIVEGVVHKEFAVEILGDFLREVQEKGLSRLALAHLAAQEHLKPACKRGLAEWPACVLDNSGLLKGRRDLFEQKELESEEGEAKHAEDGLLQAFKLVAGVLLPPSFAKALKGLKQGTLRERVHDQCKFLCEADYVALRVCSKAFMKALPLSKRFTPLTMKRLLADRKARRNESATEDAHILLGDVVRSGELSEQRRARDIQIELNVGVDTE